MVSWGELEQAVVSRLGELRADGSAVFASVRGCSPADRRGLLDALSRQRKPAARVVIDGRDATKSTEVSLWLACENLRGEPQARGELQAILPLATQALHQAVLGGHSLSLVRDESVAADDRGVAWRQVYAARPARPSQAPRFESVALCGEFADVRVEPGPVESAESRFAFPGTDGEFRQMLGRRGRQIVWSGVLRAATAEALDAIETGIEQVVDEGVTGVVTDCWGREFPECVAVAYRPKGSRGCDPIAGDVTQDFELVFRQMVAG